MTSTRRAARGASAARPVTDPTAELLAGPCIEIWADRDDTANSPFNDPWWRALRAWKVACRAWAAANGTEAWRLHNRARTRYPWSRDWLLERGHRQWLDYLEGRAAQRPDGKMPTKAESNT